MESPETVSKRVIEEMAAAFLERPPVNQHEAAACVHRWSMMSDIMQRESGGRDHNRAFWRLVETSQHDPTNWIVPPGALPHLAVAASVASAVSGPAPPVSAPPVLGQASAAVTTTAIAPVLAPGPVPTYGQPAPTPAVPAEMPRKEDGETRRQYIGRLEEWALANPGDLHARNALQQVEIQRTALDNKTQGKKDKKEKRRRDAQARDEARDAKRRKS